MFRYLKVNSSICNRDNLELIRNVVSSELTHARVIAIAVIV